MKPRIWALLACAGSGTRAGRTGPKQYQALRGLPLVQHTLAALLAVEHVQHTLVVLAPGDAYPYPQAPNLSTRHCGGETRAQSVRNGLRALQSLGAGDQDWVLVHDAARCLITPALIARLIAACMPDAVGGLLALPVTDTLLTAAENPGPARAAAHLPRSGKWLAQTPQMFRLGLLAQALEAAGEQATDEASAVQALGLEPLLVPGSAENFKVTWPQDFALAEAVLAQRASAPHAPQGGLRIGQGWDCHALVPGRKLVLGGVHIPHTAGLIGHSDADALCHAITDALLGAANLGDIGQHFPDTDARWRGADSIALLTQAMQLVRQAGLDLLNLDSTIVAQAPKLAAHVPAMQARIASALGVSAAQVNIKAKTAENLGPVGQRHSMEAQALVLLGAA